MASTALNGAGKDQNGSSREHAMRTRVVREGWPHDDCFAAHCQASLLSYCSAEDAESTVTWPERRDRFRYVRSAPDDYEHNAPWNTWTLPSRLQALFDSAQTCIAAAGTPSPVQQRVRVVLSPHLDLDALIPATDQLIRQWHQTIRDRMWAYLEIGTVLGNARPPSPCIAFATVENGATGARCLRFLRGSNIIATMSLDSLFIEHVGPNVLGLSLHGIATPLVYMHFDWSRFYYWMSRTRISRISGS